ncbi:MAG TPA: hypothetical protein VMF52_02295 [Steroidobacteraceae bacterium]|nr:hypothetical protein [Steroidobacteraceae bacterium]
MRVVIASLLVLAAAVASPARAAITQAELAGQPLTDYPYFQYVRSFHRMSPPKVGIDPNRYPAIVGKTCDVYLVAHKTSAAWASSPALVDLTPGGAMTRTFVAGTLQLNSFSVTPSGTPGLVDDAGATLGVPYDVVLDCDRDGLLDNDDFIDGLGTEPGFYMIKDPSAHGPYPVMKISYNLAPVVALAYHIPSPYRAEDACFPENIQGLKRLPIVVVGHNNGGLPADYDYICRHLASWGYVVMIPALDTSRGPVSSAKTILGHTDAFIDQAQAGTIASGLLVGHLEPRRIGWIGHGRGGEAVVIAYHALYTGGYVPKTYTRKFIRFIDSLGPTDYEWTDGAGGVGLSQPHEVNYHLWAPAAEPVVSGDPANPTMQSQPIADRATGFKLVTTLHGARLSQFGKEIMNPTVSGPCRLRTDEVHLAVLGYETAMLKHYLEGNLPPLDYLTRQYEMFHPPGFDVDLCIEVQNEYRAGAAYRVIDDFQSNPTDVVSSSGGSVWYDVDNLQEDRLDDNDTTFAWTPADPFNGAIFATAVDSSRGVTFDWTGVDKYYEQRIAVGAGDFTPYTYLSFRAAQATRHPNTVAALGDLTFSVELVDGAGHTSRINIGAYGAGIEEPYQRAGGWFDEMETIRLRLTDFLTNASGVDLAHVVSVRFRFGPSMGSDKGRIVLDDVMLTNDPLP